MPNINPSMEAMREQRRIQLEVVKKQIEELIANLDTLFGGRSKYSVNTETGEISYAQGSMEMETAELTAIAQAQEKLRKLTNELRQLNELET